MAKTDVIHVTSFSNSKGLGIASHLLRTMAKVYAVYPTYVFIGWTNVKVYQNNEGENIWDIIYHQPDVESPDQDVYKVRMESEWNGEEIPLKVPMSTKSDARNAGKKIIDEKFRLKDDIKNEIESFYESNMKDKKILAIHRRGCPYEEINVMSNEEFNNNINVILDEEDFDAVFICADNKPSKDSIISYVKDKNLEVITYDSQITESGNSVGLPWEKIEMDRNLIAKEIVIEMYLMAKCHSILRTSYSGVSQFVLYINPDIIEHSI